jgi:glycosyltransferase involved in cell wall biosynthesis
LQQHPAARFYIVGARPNEAVQALAKLPGVHVTGSVPDVRPYLAHARAAVAPLRIARGIQNKVLEAMAMSKTVVVSPQALEGITAQPGTHLLLAEDGTGFAATLALILSGKQADLGPAARTKVLENYNWDANLARVDALLEPASQERVAAPAAEAASARSNTAPSAPSAPTAPSPTSP